MQLLNTRNLTPTTFENMQLDDDSFEHSSGEDANLTIETSADLNKESWEVS